MRSYSRRRLLFGILAIAVVAELAVLAVGVVRDSRPSIAMTRPTTTVLGEPEPVETPHSRELTRVLDGSTIVPNSIRLDTPFRWRPNRYEGVDYGESYSASGALLDETGSYRAGVYAWVARMDRGKMAELLRQRQEFAKPGRCDPLDTTPGMNCVERVLPGGINASVALYDGRRSATVRAARPDGSEIQLDFRGISGDHFEDEFTFDVDILFRFAELPGLHM